MASLTNESKYGYQDGEHFGNWGPTFPIFARVVNGELYAVAREDNPASTERFGKMFQLSRAYLKGTIFAEYPSDADYFSDRPNQIEDTSVAGNEFVKSTDTGLLLSRPNAMALPTLPVKETEKTTDPVKTTPATTTTPTTIPTSIAAATTATQLPQWIWLALGAAAVGTLIGVFMWLDKRKKA